MSKGATLIMLGCLVAFALTAKPPPQDRTRCVKRSNQKVPWDGVMWLCICDYHANYEKEFGFVNRLLWECTYTGKLPKATPPTQQGKICAKVKSVETVPANGWSWTCACNKGLMNKQAKWSCKQKNKL